MLLKLFSDKNGVLKTLSKQQTPTLL